MPYCRSRLRTLRRPTVEVMVGSVGIGGNHPVRLQSMTTSDTQDIDATVRQSVALAEVGCEIVRITAPNVQAARCLREIRARFSAAGFARVPLVADIHFLPQAAMEAVEHVEKVRINPGNYADKKRFAVREYSDADYERELQRLHDAFSPLVRRARELGRSLRIGTNHGSLSDRILNRYGDTPLGMVESALEFLRIAEANGFRQLILSMKASNPKVMIQAYRLLVARMDAEGMAYPLHLGVTEAGDGEDGRIKSAIGIGSLLLDGLGDTIRVSLTEDSVYEIPVARALADRAMALWREGGAAASDTEADARPADPFRYDRRSTVPVTLAPGLAAGGDAPPRVLVRTADLWPSSLPGLSEDTPAEGLVVPVSTEVELEALSARLAQTRPPAAFLAVEAGPALPLDTLRRFAGNCPVPLALILPFTPATGSDFTALAEASQTAGPSLVAAVEPADVPALAAALKSLPGARVLVTLRPPSAARRAAGAHAVGAYRELARALADAGCRAPLWIRNSPATAVVPGPAFLDKLLEASVLTGSLLADGFGDAVSIETEADLVRSVRLAYNVLQGAGARISKTEFVACPSCGRTLFDLQTTTQRIREKTGHLKGVKIAIMGCIVNGPGEMADADFGYVGGAPGRINLYIGKTCVQYNVPQAEADERLIALIRENGKWTDPLPAPAGL